MKDDTATLTSAGVCTNSIITLNGEKVDVRKTCRAAMIHY
jgi:hypothetical protein